MTEEATEQLIRRIVKEIFNEMEIKLWRRLAVAISASVLSIVGTCAATYFQAVQMVGSFVEDRSLIPNHAITVAPTALDLPYQAREIVDTELLSEVDLRPNSELLVAVSSNVESNYKPGDPPTKTGIPSSDINMVVAIEIHNSNEPNKPVLRALDRVALQSSGFDNGNMAEVLAFTYNWVFSAKDLASDSTTTTQKYIISFKIISCDTGEHPVSGAKLRPGRRMYSQELLQRRML